MFVGRLACTVKVSTLFLNRYRQRANAQVELLSPHLDDYKITPATRVSDGTAAFAITPSESVVSSFTQPEGTPKKQITAVAALLQQSASAIVTLKESGIDRPSKLDGRQESHGPLLNTYLS